MTELLRAEHVAKHYQVASLIKKKAPKVVLSDINLSIAEGESVGLVGLSGSGKSTLCRLLLGLEQPSQGALFFENNHYACFDKKAWCQFRCNIQMVFQDSISAVNPRMSIGEIIAEPLQYLLKLSKKEQIKCTHELLEQVGLQSSDAQKKAGQMSGGQLQRVCLARALAPKPRLIALDESLSSLDLILQHQLIDLLKHIQAEQGTSYLFVTHDLRLVYQFCQRVIVLDQGEMVENTQVHKGMEWQSETQVHKGMEWQSEMGKILQSAILPAMPAAV